MQSQNSQNIPELFASESLEEQSRRQLASGKYAQAEALLRQALEKREKALGGDDPSVAAVKAELATLCCMNKKYEEAEALFKSAAEIAEKAYYAEHTRVGDVLFPYARCLAAQGKFAEAEPVAKRALDIYHKTLVPEHRNTLELTLLLAAIYSRQDKHADAEGTLVKALKQVQTPLGPADEFQHELARVYHAQGKNAEAEKAFLAAEQEFMQRAKYQRLAECLEAHAQFLKDTGRKEEAEKFASRARLVRESTAGENDTRRLFPSTLLRT